MKMKKIQSWGNNFEKNVTVSPAFKGNSFINLGNQNSYGDCFIPVSNNSLIQTNKKLENSSHFSSSITIQEYINKNQNFLYGIPGRSSVTLAGAIASDTHGKDNTWGGGFSKNILKFHLKTSNEEIIECSPQKNFDVFKATIGGYGLTGSIENVVFKSNVIPKYSSMEKEVSKGSGFENLFLEFKENKFEYWVAWVNLLSKNQNYVIEKTKFNNKENNFKIKNDSVSEFKNFSVPFIGTNNFYLMNMINATYFIISSDKSNKLINYDKSFFPLSLLTDTRNISSNRKILQVQFSIPLKNQKNIPHLISCLIHKQNPLLCSVKRINKKEYTNNLSFLQDGWTVAVDFPEKSFNIASYKTFIKKLISEEGKIYLAKDSLLEKKDFREMYPEFSKWKEVVDKIDPEKKFQSRLSFRLGLK